jgi:DNA polymerase III sliding clamp (beta) subunit (PCNA family)
MSTAVIQQMVEQNLNKSNSYALKARAVALWNADREVFGRSQDSARALGDALVKVKAVIPHGEFKPWLKENGIDRNRASYCMRVVTGKDAAAKAKAAPHVVTIKNGMLVRWNDKIFKVLESSEWKADELAEFHRLVLHVEPAPATPPQEDVVEAPVVPAIEEPYDGRPPKVEFDAGELNKAIRRLGDLVSANAGRVGIASGQVELVGDNASLRIALAKARTFGDFNVAIQHGELAPAIKNITGAVTIMEDGTLQSGGLSTKLKCLAPDTELRCFPVEDAVTRVEGINLSRLKAQHKLVAFAIPPADGRFVIPCGLLTSENGILRMVATDGKFLAMSDTPAEHGDFAFTIPQPAFELLHKMDGETLDITETEHFWRFSTRTETLVYTKTHAEFPPYQKVVPRNHDGWTKITVNSGVLASALKRLRPHADDDMPGVLFTVGDGALLLEAEHNEGDPAGFTYSLRPATESIKVLVGGSPVIVKLNANRFLPFLERVKGTVEFYVKNSEAVVDCFAPAIDGYRFFVMPMRLTEDYAAAKAGHEQMLKERAERDAALLAQSKAKVAEGIKT